MPARSTVSRGSWLLQGDQRCWVYSVLRGDTPFCLPAAQVQLLPPWKPFDGLPGDDQPALQRAPLHVLLVSRS